MTCSKLLFRYFASTVFMLLLAACLTPPPSVQPDRAAINEASIGFLLIDQNTGQQLASRNPDKLFIPASTAKVPSSIAALGILGASYRFETGLYSNGPINNGVLNGDIILKGGGDPLLSIQDLMNLAERLYDLGIRKVNGRFIYDDTFLTSTREINPAQPEAAPYNPGLSALSLDFNRVHLHWSANRSGRKPTPGVGQSDVMFSINNTGTQQPFTFTGTPAHEGWHFQPDQLPPSSNEEGTASLPIKNPALRTARSFQKLATISGINLPAPEPGQTPKQATLLAKTLSTDLYRTLHAGLEFSNNMMSELIGAMAARALMKAPAPLPTPLTDSSAALTSWLQSQLPETKWQGYQMFNHSGLSAKSRVSPRQMVALLRYASQQRYDGNSYKALLPASGWRGAFRQRYRNPSAEARIWAKTGTMNYAKGLSGYLYTKSGKRCIFALYMTDFESRQAYDSNPNQLKSAARKNAKTWITKAETMEEALIQKWIARY